MSYSLTSRLCLYVWVGALETDIISLIYTFWTCHFTLHTSLLYVLLVDPLAFQFIFKINADVQASKSNADVQAGGGDNGNSSVSDGSGGTDANMVIGITVGGTCGTIMLMLVLAITGVCKFYAPTKATER